MHPIILMSALAVTSGLFGGGRAGCPSGHCGSAVLQVPGYQYTHTMPVSQAQAPSSPIAQPAHYATGYVYPVSYQQPAPAASAPSAQGWLTPGAPVATAPQYYYYVYPAAMACPGGGCARR